MNGTAPEHEALAAGYAALAGDLGLLFAAESHAGMVRVLREEARPPACRRRWNSAGGSGADEAG